MNVMSIGCCELRKNCLNVKNNPWVTFGMSDAIVNDAADFSIRRPPITITLREIMQAPIDLLNAIRRDGEEARKVLKELAFDQESPVITTDQARAEMAIAGKELERAYREDGELSRKLNPGPKNPELSASIYY